MSQKSSKAPTRARAAPRKEGPRDKREAAGKRGATGERGERGERGETGPPGPRDMRVVAALESAVQELQVQFQRIAQIQQQLDDLTRQVRALQERASTSFGSSAGARH